MHPKKPVPVKLFCGVLYSDMARRQQARAMLEDQWGPVEWQSKEFPFDITDYYVAEMGNPIYRLFYSFRNLIDPGQLSQIKIECNRIEETISKTGNRLVNLDPGYLDSDKVVLASAKYAGHKVYLDMGIYADVTLMYHKGKYWPSAWSFPDFKSDRYQEIFMHLRALYKGQLKKLDSSSQDRNRINID